MNGLSQLCIEKNDEVAPCPKNAQKKLGRRLVESDFCAEHKDKTSRRLPHVADGQDTFEKRELKSRSIRNVGSTQIKATLKKTPQEPRNCNLETNGSLEPSS